MSLVLGPDEQVFYPQPYVPGEPATLIITNRRMVRITDLGLAEFPVREIDFVGRSAGRPTLVAGAILLVLGLGLAIFGIVTAATTSGPIDRWLSTKPAKGPALPPLPPLPTPGAPAPSAPPPASEEGAGEEADEEGAEEEGEEDEGGLGQVGGVLLAVGGLAVLGVGALLVRRRSYQVICRLQGRLVHIDVASEREQTVILSTLGSAVSTAKMMGGPPAAAVPATPAPPPVEMEVDDGGDPVRALQELKAKKDAGQIDQNTFDRKRAILLERLSARR